MSGNLTGRHVRGRIERGLESFRIVLINGPRQSGKTTLAQMMIDKYGGSYLSLDHQPTLTNVLDDPHGLLSSLDTPIVIDEIQRGGDFLVRAIKLWIDEDNTPGRLLLTGSTNFLTVPVLSESLAGRMVPYQLWPFSEAELTETEVTCIDGWFDEPFGNAKLSSDKGLEREDYMQMVCRGGYPEMVGLTDMATRVDWVNAYLDTVVRRDILPLSAIRKVANLNQLLGWAAASTSSELNIRGTSQELGIHKDTLQSYLEWLETVHLVHTLPSWSRNPIARVVRRPKLHMSDTGLVSGLLNLTPEKLSDYSCPSTGPVLESFVVNEIIRQLAAAQSRIACSHFRDHNGHEVDLILEKGDGSMIAIEVKATTSPSSRHTKSLEWLRDKVDTVTPGAFRAGYLLHTGEHRLRLSDRIYLRPISALWTPPKPDQLSLST